MPSARARFQNVIDLRTALVPARCVLCHGPLEDRAQWLCTGCHDDLPWLGCACPSCAVPRPDASCCPSCTERRPPQDTAVAAFHFRGAVRQAILHLKYHAGFSNTQWLGNALAKVIRAREAPVPDLLIPVPLHCARLRRRGYNQALELARVVGDRLRIPVQWHSVQRIRATADQIGQDRDARRQNLRGAFRAGSTLAGQHIALLDDVMTTGSTLAELARACRTAGATHIECWAIARA